MTLSAKSKWIRLPELKEAPSEVLEALSAYEPIVQQLLYNRGIYTREEADLYLYATGSLYDPFEMLGMKQGVDLILAALENNEPVAVYGDYDVDGISATCILVQVMRKIGSGKVISYIPDRFEEGYGLNMEAMRKLSEEGIRLVVTVDCGIRSITEVRYGRELGMKVIVTDHHEPGDEIPQADVVICPKQPGDQYRERFLAGAGIAFKVAQALLAAHPVPGTDYKDWLDIAALATVADIVPLIGENRSIVRAGLLRMRTFPRPAIQILSQTAGFPISRIDPHTIGFYIGPRLNAAGRLDNARIALDLLMSETVEEAQPYAEEVEKLNNQRRAMAQTIQEKTVSRVDPDHVPNVILARDASFGLNENDAAKLAGIVGLAASRVSETFYRPSIVGTILSEFTRASCRSIEGFSIIRALDACADLIDHHGGHDMAAGLTVPNENWNALERRLNEIAAEEFKNIDLRPTSKYDMEYPTSMLSLDQVRHVRDLLDKFAPEGANNPEPLFLFRDVRIRNKRLIGNEQKHIKMFGDCGGYPVEVLGWNCSHFFSQILNGSHVDILGLPEINEYNGRVSVQITMKDIRTAELY